MQMVRWPIGRGIGRHLSGEATSPVPGREATELGYPITISFYGLRREAISSVSAFLFRKWPGEWEEVPVFFSHDPELIRKRAVLTRQPDTVWLIAKRPLAAETMYTVFYECVVRLPGKAARKV